MLVTVTDEVESRRQAAEVFGERFPEIERYVDILTYRGVEWGLLGPREPERIWARHILNCAALDSVIPHGVAVADVGSGAGLPGLVIAILRPDLQVTLIESLHRRAEFLRLAVDKLGLGSRVDVLLGRAEDQSLTVDIVTCRAVANLTRLIGWTTPLFLPEGRLVALKGDRAEGEVSEARSTLRKQQLTAEVMSLRAHPSSEPTRAVVVRRSV